MEKIKSLLSNITPINIVLAGLVIFFIRYAAAPVSVAKVKYVPPAVKKASAENAPKADKGDDKTPSPSDYMIIAEQNLFHPNRIIPAPKAQAAPLPQPEFVLYGTLITDGVQIAYLDDKKSDDKKKGSQAKKQTALRMGDSMSGFVLKEVAPDRVLMQRGEEKVTVSLSQAKLREAPAPAPAPSAAAQAPGPGPNAPAQPSPPSAQFPTRRRQPSSQASSAPAEQPATQQNSVAPPASRDKGVNTFLDLFKRKGSKAPAQ